MANARSSDGLSIYNIATPSNVASITLVKNIPATNNVAVDPRLGAANSMSVVFSTARNRAYVVMRGVSGIPVLDISGGQGSPTPKNFVNDIVGAAIIGREGVDMVITPDGEHVLVNNGKNNSVSVVDLDLADTSNTAVIGTISLGTASSRCPTR